MAKAAKLRVIEREASKVGGLRCQEWERRLDRALLESWHMGRIGKWRTWLAEAFCHTLTINQGDLRALGISRTLVENKAAGSDTRPFTEHQEKGSREGVQRATTAILKERRISHPESGMRKKLEGWSLSIFPRVRATRAVKMISRLTKLTAPRVSAAILRTLWSGWCTKRRFGAKGPCIFCGYLDGDSVEHALKCKVLSQFGAEKLALPYHTDPQKRGMSFLILEPALELTDERLVLGALRTAAAYTVHCKFRRNPSRLGSEGAVRKALEQCCKELVQGHAGSTSIYDNRWNK